MSDLRDVLAAMPPELHGELVAGLLDETLKRAKLAGMPPEAVAHGLLTLTISTMVGAVGPLETANWLVRLARGVLENMQHAERSDLN